MRLWQIFLLERLRALKNAADKLKRRIFIKLYADTDNLDYVLVVGKE